MGKYILRNSWCASLLLFSLLLLYSCESRSKIKDKALEEGSNISRSDCIDPPHSNDYREYQHGIDFIKHTDSSYYLIWGSSGIFPGGADKNGKWTHDIYYSGLNISNPIINPIRLISAWEAQEPPSTAISANGNIFITMEDGDDVKNTIAQRYAVFNNDMKAIKPYPNMIYDGGHSGHAASSGNDFIVFWSNDWDDSVPGADGIGTGLDVIADIFSSEGEFRKRIDIAKGETRDWWPLVAGSPTSACMIWQRYVKGDKYSNLHYSIYDTQTGKILKDALEIENSVKYYTYDVQYLVNIDRFLITGTYYTGGGFAYLLDRNGNIVGQNKEINGIVREAQGVSGNINGKEIIAYAKDSTGLLLLKADKEKIGQAGLIKDDYKWYGSGTDGIFLNDSTIYMVSLSPCGLISRKINIAF